jgi:hypothetical protein
MVLMMGPALLALPGAVYAADAPAQGERESLAPAICEQRRAREAELAQSDSVVKQTLAKTLKEPELQICEVREHWRWREDGAVEPPSRSPRDPRPGQWFAATVETLLWFAVGLFIAVAGWWLWRHAPGAFSQARQRAVKSGSPLVQGRDEVTVPPDAGLGDTAWQLWSEGQPREALRMLYQGSLAGLATWHSLPVRPSATEVECLRLATAHLTDPELLGFMRRLTRAWQAIAYAHRVPDATEAHGLCAEWPQHFAKATLPPLQKGGWGGLRT